MSAIILESYKFPVLQMVNKNTPKNDEMLLSLHYNADKITPDTQNHFTGRCKIEMCFKAEHKLPDKTFLVSIEIEGDFLDKSERPDHELRKTAVIKELLPQISAVMRAAMALAKISPSLIPESLLAEFDT